MMDALMDWSLPVGLVSYVVPFLVLLTLVVFVHELGHYLVARWFGVRSEVFSVGFGPEMIGRTDRQGTRWRFSWIPLGGYVRFVGDEDAASGTSHPEAARIPGSFSGATVGRRAAIVAAGPIMNFIFGAIVLVVIAWVGGVPGERPVVGSILKSEEVTALGLERGDQIISVNGVQVDSFVDAMRTIEQTGAREISLVVIRDGQRNSVLGIWVREAHVASVLGGSPADAAGFRSGDIIQTIDGQPVATFRDVQIHVRGSGGDLLAFEVARDGKLISLSAAPKIQERIHPVSGETEQIPVLGIGHDQVFPFLPGRERVGFGGAVVFGFARTALVIGVSLAYVGEIIAGSSSADQLGGPIAIAEFSGDAAKRGAWDFFFILAVISTSIGLINLFPIPVLDGGHLVLFAIEGIRKKPLDERVQRIAMRVGMGLILLLVVLVTYNDILRL